MSSHGMNASQSLGPGAFQTRRAPSHAPRAGRSSGAASPMARGRGRVAQRASATSAVFGSMKVELTNARAIVGTGTMNSDNAGQVWFDYDGKPFPSKIDWRSATTLTFTPSMGKASTSFASDWEYLFNGQWLGPRLVKL